MTSTTVVEELAGTWRQLSCIEDGVTMSLAMDTFVSFDGNSFNVTQSDGTILIKGFYSVNTATDRGTMDWTDTFGPDTGKTFPAIYTLDGDSFAFCAADEGMERPAGFTPIKGHTIRTFIRI